MHAKLRMSGVIFIKKSIFYDIKCILHGRFRHVWSKQIIYKCMQACIRRNTWHKYKKSFKQKLNRTIQPKQQSTARKPQKTTHATPQTSQGNERGRGQGTYKARDARKSMKKSSKAWLRQEGLESSYRCVRRRTSLVERRGKRVKMVKGWGFYRKGKIDMRKGVWQAKGHWPWQPPRQLMKITAHLKVKGWRCRANVMAPAAGSKLLA